MPPFSQASCCALQSSCSTPTSRIACQKSSGRCAMLKFELLRDAGVLVVEPRDALTAEDFQAVAQTVDPFIQANGKLTGLLVDAPSFPLLGGVGRTDRTHAVRS